MSKGFYVRYIDLLDGKKIKEAGFTAKNETELRLKLAKWYYKPLKIITQEYYLLLLKNNILKENF